MAGKKKNARTVGASTVHLHVDSGTSDRETDDEEVQAIDEMEDGALFRAMDDIRQVEGAKAEVYRVAPADKIGHCRTYPVSVFSLEKVTADYGPGQYRVKFKGPGDKYIKGGGTIHIAEGVGAGGAAPVSGGIQELLAFLKAEREREQAEREKGTARWIKWAELLAPLALPKILDIMTGGGKSSMRDLVATMKDMRELQAPPTDLKAQFGDVINILQGARDLVGGGDEGKGTGATFVDLLRDFIQSPAMGALAGAIPGLTAPRPLPFPSNQAMVPPAPALAVQPASAGNSVSAPGGASPSSNQPDMFQQLQWLRATLVQLLAQASKPGSNPRLYGEVVLDNLPPFITDAALLERLSKDDWFAQLQQLEPNVTAHAEWFQRFRDYAVKMLTKRVRKAQETANPELPGENQPMTGGEGGDLE